MGRVFVVVLEGRAYECKFCKTHLALADDLVSRVILPPLPSFLMVYFWNIRFEFLWECILIWGCWYGVGSVVVAG